MFYYHPSVPQAYRDMKELNYVVDNGLFLRNLHRWAAHLMVFGGVSPHAPGLLPPRLPPAPPVQLGRRGRPPHRDAAPLVHGLPAPLGPARVLGCLGGHEHGEGSSPRRREDPLPAPRRATSSPRTRSSASTCSTASSSRWRSCSSSPFTSGASARTAASRGRPPTRTTCATRRPHERRPGAPRRRIDRSAHRAAPGGARPARHPAGCAPHRRAVRDDLPPSDRPRGHPVPGRRHRALPRRRSSSTRPSRASRTRSRRPIPRRPRGTSWACRSCCTTSRRSSPASSCPASSSSRSP